MSVSPVTTKQQPVSRINYYTANIHNATASEAEVTGNKNKEV
jgi:hypothetical protein